MNGKRDTYMKMEREGEINGKREIERERKGEREGEINVKRMMKMRKM
jgi:hypothetical protein